MRAAEEPAIPDPTTMRRLLSWTEEAEEVYRAEKTRTGSTDGAGRWYLPAFRRNALDVTNARRAPPGRCCKDIDVVRGEEKDERIAEAPRLLQEERDDDAAATAAFCVERSMIVG